MICLPESDDFLFWQSAFSRVLERAKPLHIKQARWDWIKDWCDKMNTSEVMSELCIFGWLINDIFSCNSPDPSKGNYFGDGLLIHVTSPWNPRNEGMKIHDIQEDRIVLLQADDYLRTYFKKRGTFPNQSTLMKVI